jgi:ankyrin repeat protein
MKNIKQYTDHIRESSDQDEINRKLLDASQEGNLKNVKSLRDRGANVNAENWEKKTPLHLAAFYGRTGAARLLIGRGAQVDAEDVDKWTPLHLAAATGHTEIARLLILNGADPSKAFDDLGAIIDFFDGSIGWMPEEFKSKLERRVRSRQAFGRF